MHFDCYISVILIGQLLHFDCYISVIFIGWLDPLIVIITFVSYIPRRPTFSGNLILCLCSIVKGGFPLGEATHSSFCLIIKAYNYLSFYFYAIWVFFCLTFSFKAYDPWGWLLKISHLGIFYIKLLWIISNYDIFYILRRHIKVPMVKILGFGLLYFWRYRLWNLVFFTSPKISVKQVILVFSL